MQHPIKVTLYNTSIVTSLYDPLIALVFANNFFMAEKKFIISVVKFFYIYLLHIDKG